MPEAKLPPLHFFRVLPGEVFQVLLPSLDASVRLPAATNGEFFWKPAAGATQALQLVELVSEPVRQIRCGDGNRINALQAGFPFKGQDTLPGVKKRWELKPSAGSENRRNGFKIPAAGREQAR